MCTPTAAGTCRYRRGCSTIADNQQRPSTCTKRQRITLHSPQGSGLTQHHTHSQHCKTIGHAGDVSLVQERAICIDVRSHRPHCQDCLLDSLLVCQEPKAVAAVRAHVPPPRLSTTTPGIFRGFCQPRPRRNPLAISQFLSIGAVHGVAHDQRLIHFAGLAAGIREVAVVPAVAGTIRDAGFLNSAVLAEVVERTRYSSSEAPHVV